MSTLRHEPAPKPVAEQQDDPELAAGIRIRDSELGQIAEILGPSMVKAIPKIILKHPDSDLDALMHSVVQDRDLPVHILAIIRKYIRNIMGDPRIHAAQSSELEYTQQRKYEDQLAAAIAASTQPNSFPEGDYYFGGRAIKCAEKLQVGPQSFIMQCVPSEFLGWEGWLPGESLTIEGNSITMKNKHGTYEGEWNPGDRTIEWKKEGSPTLHRKWWYGRPGPALEIDPVIYKSTPELEPEPGLEPEPIIVEARLVEPDDSDLPILPVLHTTGASKKKKAKSRRKTKKKIRSSKGSKKLKRYKRRPKSHTKRLIKKTKSRKLSKRK
jgi:hypothetical protein